VEELVDKCKAIVEAEGESLNNEEYVNEKDPSILRFLLASREEVSNKYSINQLTKNVDSDI
jgi:carotene epsilon-monooxygenase